MKKRKDIKVEMYKKQNGKCAIAETLLPEDFELFDKHRLIPKSEGGTYTKENTRVITPVEHMKHHDNLRLRDEEMKKLKARIDDRNQVLKLKNKVNNQLLAFKRNTDDSLPDTLEFLEGYKEDLEKKVTERTKVIKKQINRLRKENLFIDSLLKLKGIKEITVAYCLVYIDLEKARHASSLSAYVGLDKPASKRYTKGQSSGGNKNLRTALFAMAISQVMSKGVYEPVYRNRRQRTDNSERIVESRFGKGDLRKVPWKDAKPIHRQHDAYRILIKHFLHDYWLVGRSLSGLPTTPPYVQSVLGHNGIISPEERGWEVDGWEFIRDENEVVSLIENQGMK